MFRNTVILTAVYTQFTQIFYCINCLNNSECFMFISVVFTSENIQVLVMRRYRKLLRIKNYSLLQPTLNTISNQVSQSERNILQVIVKSIDQESPYIAINKSTNDTTSTLSITTNDICYNWLLLFGITTRLHFVLLLY